MGLRALQKNLEIQDKKAKRICDLVDRCQDFRLAVLGPGIKAIQEDFELTLDAKISTIDSNEKFQLKVPSADSEAALEGVNTLDGLQQLFDFITLLNKDKKLNKKIKTNLKWD